MKNVTDEKKSAMPALRPRRLNEKDLDDLLAYLNTLRGFDPAVKK